MEMNGFWNELHSKPNYMPQKIDTSQQKDLESLRIKYSPGKYKHKQSRVEIY